MAIIDAARELSIEELDQVTGGCTCGAGSGCIQPGPTQSSGVANYFTFFNCSGTLVDFKRVPLRH
jgi:bacteriocin-like protein